MTASVGLDGVYYLSYSGSIAALANFGASGNLTGDLLLGYTVTASQGLIYGIDQRYTGNGDRASILIAETALGPTAVATSSLSIGDVTDGYVPFDVEVPEDQLALSPPQPYLNVLKDIHLIVGPNGGSAGISFVQQSFHQTSVPDGGLTLALLGISLAGVEGLRRRFKA